VIGSLLARAAAFAGKAVITVAANAVAAELKKPETQARLAESALKARDSGARALGRAVGTLRNRL